MGFYTLAYLSLRFVTLVDAERTPELIPLVLAALAVFQGTVCGILGLVFQAAGGAPGRAGFPRYALVLFVPLLWIHIKISLLVSVAWAIAVGVWHAVTGAPLDAAAGQVLFWGAPGFRLLSSIAALYSVPLCILSWLRRERRSHLREGWGLLAARAGTSAGLLGLSLLTIAAAAVLHYGRGPEAAMQEPDVAETLVLLLYSYLELVVFFGATRVVLDRFLPGRPAPLPAAGASAPGPPA